MADEPIAPATAPAASAPAAAPAAAPASAPAPAADAPAPAPAPAPAADALAPAAGDAPPADGAGLIDKVTGTEKPADKLPGDEPTLLETVGREEEKSGDKPADAKPGDKPTDAPVVTFQPFHAPDGIKLDDTRVTELNELVTKDLPPQERRDAMIEMHIAEMQRYDTQLRQDQQNAFRDTRAEWRKQLMADPELGGSGFETTKLTGAEMRDLFASRYKPGTEQYKQEMTEFNDMLRYTGVGDHPAFWRLLNNVGRKFKEPASPQHDFKPPPDLGRRPGGTGKRSAMYDHPTSSQNRDR